MNIFIYHMISTLTKLCITKSWNFFFQNLIEHIHWYLRITLSINCVKTKKKHFHKSKLACIILVLKIPHLTIHGAVLGMRWDVYVIWWTHWSPNTRNLALNDLNNNVLSLIFLDRVLNYKTGLCHWSPRWSPFFGVIWTQVSTLSVLFVDF